ncbi:MAG: hypothetical protein [Caudoviricetes sp.]|nr:MAG: hypothetical protein [Caudoviricetes sp.]
MKEENIKIGDCVYHMRKASFMDTKDQAFKLTALLKGCFTNTDKGNFDVGQLIANLNSKEIDEITKFLCAQTSVTDENGKKLLLFKTDEFESFFGEHQDQYFQFLFAGVKFHFLGFLPNGLASKVNTLDLEKAAGLVM